MESNKIYLFPVSTIGQLRNAMDGISNDTQLYGQVELPGDNVFRMKIDFCPNIPGDSGTCLVFTPIESDLGNSAPKVEIVVPTPTLIL